MSYYYACAFGSGLDAGKAIQIENSIHIDTTSPEFLKRGRGLINLPMSELKERRKISADHERDIYAKLNSIVNEWKRQAAKTALIDEIMCYCKTKPSKHTANKWTEQDGGKHEISNAVYAMCYHISDFDNVFYATWQLLTNAPRTDSCYSNKQIAGQENKRFTDKSDAEEYIDGRKKAYAHLFGEISPPIPEEYKELFMMNGFLIKGYRLEEPQEKAGA